MPADVTSWVPGADASPFNLQALPYGVLDAGDGPFVAVRIGDQALNLTAAFAAHEPELADLVAEPSLDALMAAGPEQWRRVRVRVATWLGEDGGADRVGRYLVPLAGTTAHLPFTVADYVDFYASRTHAETVGAIFRPGADALTPNWLHLPIGYHGRAGTVVVSGTDVRRPQGQRRDPDGGPPLFGPSTKLDIECELGFVVGAPSDTPVAVADVDQHVFGVVLLNDWSARDIQAWEYVPLGPFLGKSFATSVSAWVLPTAALYGARVAPPRREHRLLPYLAGETHGFDVQCEVSINGTVVSRPPYRDMYYTPGQMLAHLSVNGATVRTGDLFASGTISGPERDQRGCLLELTWDGRDPLTLADGSTRTFLQDGDEVVITATAPRVDGGRVGLGEVRGRIVGA